jgi:hypothetical protein
MLVRISVRDGRAPVVEILIGGAILDGPPAPQTTSVEFVIIVRDADSTDPEKGGFEGRFVVGRLRQPERSLEPHRRRGGDTRSRQFASITGLDPVGADLRAACKAPTALHDVLATLLAEYEVDEPTARADLLALVEELVDKRLVVIAGDAA